MYKERYILYSKQFTKNCHQNIQEKSLGTNQFICRVLLMGVLLVLNWLVHLLKYIVYFYVFGTTHSIYYRSDKMSYFISIAEVSQKYKAPVIFKKCKIITLVIKTTLNRTCQTFEHPGAFLKRG